MDEQNALNFFATIREDCLKGAVVGFIGELGAGKTHFIRYILNAFSEKLSEQVTSPTYTLCNIYKTPGFEVHHYDLYRMESEDDLYEIGIHDSFENETSLILIEWVDLYPVLIERCDYLVRISILDSGARDYRIDVLDDQTGTDR